MVRMIRSLIASFVAALAFVGAAAAQPGPVPGPGPGPPPTPWLYAAPSVYLPPGNCVTLPQTVTGGCPGAGNAINVSNGYFVNGVSIAPVTGGANGQLLQGVTSNPPIWTGSPTLSTSLTVPEVIGGTPANQAMTILATANGTPSSTDSVSVLTHTMTVAASLWGGQSALIVGAANSGAVIQIFSPTGSGPQTIIGQNGATGTLTLPASATFLAGLAITQTWTGTNTYNTPIVLTGGVGTPGAGTGQIGATSTLGAILVGNGSSFDVALQNKNNTSVCLIPTGSAAFECFNSGIGSTSSDGIVLFNNTVAAASAQQFSPRLHFIGQGWKTNATAGSQTTDFIAEVQPLQGAANPDSTLVFSSQVNAGGYTPQVVMTDGTFVTLSTAVGGTGVLIQGQAGDLQVGRGSQLGFIFFGTSAGNSFFGLNGANNWQFGGSGSTSSLTFGSNAAESATIQSTSGAASGDSLTLKASSITLQSFSGTTTVNCGVANTSNCIFNMAGSASGSTALVTQANASGTVTLPNGATTLAGLATIETFSAAQTFSNQIINTAARTIASATAATLDDVFVQAETTTITGNTGSPITALSKVHLGQPTFTDSSAVTVTTAATLTIDNAPAQAGSVTITNAYALNVVAGSTLLGGKVFMSGLTAGSGTKAMCINATANEVQTDTSATICGISALRYKNLISEITPDQGLGILTLRGETYRYKPDVMQDAKVHVSLIADDMSALNHDCAEYSAKGVENYMDRCFEAYQVAYDKKLWEIIGKLTNRLPANDGLRDEVQTLRR